MDVWLICEMAPLSLKSEMQSSLVGPFHVSDMSILRLKWIRVLSAPIKIKLVLEVLHANRLEPMYRG